MLWDIDSGLAQLDKYFHSPDTHVVAGALLGVGIINTNVQSDCDPVSCKEFLQYKIFSKRN